MKLKYAVLPAAVAMLFSAASFAESNGSIYFNGTVKAPTCTVNNGAGDLNIFLGDYEVTDFPTVGIMKKGPQKVVLDLTGCTGYYADLSLMADNPLGEDQIKLNDNGAKGLVIVLKDGENENDPNRKINGTWTRTPIDTATGTAKFEYQPFLVRTTDYMQAGQINARVAYTIRYL